MLKACQRRVTTKAGGDQNGANLRAASYAPNLLNQYVSRTVPGAFDVLGVAKANATVTVNGGGTYRKGEYFRTELGVSNGGAAAYPQVTVTSVVGSDSTNQTGHVFVPATPEVYSHDADGNVTQDGRWNYTWDAENRLAALETTTGAVSGGAPKQRIEFLYDHQGRRVRKTVLDWDAGSSAWTAAADWAYVYDGWNLMAELFALDVPGLPLPNRTYVWGLDLSGSAQGAGGVGGLLQINNAGWFNWMIYDGNGNVAALMDAANGTETAHYEYGPFGELLRSTGPLAKANSFRFSTKYQDDETGFLYYGYRYYDPSTGRWLSRDPIEESGGVNLFNFVRNDSISSIDSFGLRDLTAQEQAVLDELASTVRKIRDNKVLMKDAGNREFAAALEAVKKDVETMIKSIQSEKDPPLTRIGLQALRVWADKDSAVSYDWSKQDINTCNRFVADVVAEAGYDVNVIRRPSTFWREFRIPGATEWHQNGTIGDFEITWRVYSDTLHYGTKPTDKKDVTVKLTQPIKAGQVERLASASPPGTGNVKPTFGNLISYPHHVGVYIGRGLYLSSSTDDPTGIVQQRGVGVNVRFVNMNFNQLYRSPKDR